MYYTNSIQYMFVGQGQEIYHRLLRNRPLTDLGGRVGTQSSSINSPGRLILHNPLDVLQHVSQASLLYANSRGTHRIIIPWLVLKPIHRETSRFLEITIRVRICDKGRRLLERIPFEAVEYCHGRVFDEEIVCGVVELVFRVEGSPLTGLLEAH